MKDVITLNALTFICISLALYLPEINKRTNLIPIQQDISKEKFSSPLDMGLKAYMHAFSPST